MRKYFFLLVFALNFQAGYSQKIFFAKANYTDTVVLEGNLPSLALKAIAAYNEPEAANYYDNLFRLQMIAGQNEASANTLKKLAFLALGDSVTENALGFAYKIYNATLAVKPVTTEFDKTYISIFQKNFISLTDDGKNWAAEYFETDIEQLQIGLKTTLKALSNSDSITVEDAVKLCRSFCSYKTYSITQPLANGILAAVENEKYNRDDSVLVKMPDGGIVSLTIVRDRKITKPQPVVLMYNIYAGKDAARCKDAVAKGYIGIVANTRGKRLSPDEIEPFENDAKDAYHIIDWISKQKWCNGKVGMYGGSYLGFSQWSAVKYLHPALKTIVPQVAVAAGVDFPRHNGVYMNFMLRWLHFVTDNKLTNTSEFSDTKKWNQLFSDWYQQGKSFRSIDSMEGRPNKLFQRWLNHPDYDTYWQNMTPQKAEFSKINIPIFTTTGYWDDDQTGALYYYHQYQQWNKNDNYYLLIGPYDHGGSQGYPKPSLSGYTIDSVANIPIQDIIFQWFDYVLKGSPRPAILKDKVNFEVMGNNEWKHVASLDKMHNDTLRFYLGSNTNGNQYMLSKKRPLPTKFIAQTVDLKDRSELRLMNEEVSMFQTLVDSALNPQKEQLVFVSDPVDKPFAISGAATASIVASINKKDMDVMFDLYEQTPDGMYIALAANLQRASYVKDNSKRHLLTPNKIESINIAHTYITCRQLQKGSRIIVVLGVNKNLNWQVNYGTGKDVSDETMDDAAVPMQIKWFNNSCIKIPVLR